MQKYIVAWGSGGVGITEHGEKLSKMGWYIKDLQYIKYDTFREAEEAALAHLREIVPEGVAIPNMIVLEQMVFKSSLVKTCIARRDGEEVEHED